MTYIAVNGKNNGWVKPNKVELTSKITVENIQEMIDTIEERSGDVPNIILCSWKGRRVLQKLFAEKNIALENTVLDGGYKAISYNGIPIVVDKYYLSKNAKAARAFQLIQDLVNSDEKVLVFSWVRYLKPILRPKRRSA